MLKQGKKKPDTSTNAFLMEVLKNKILISILRTDAQKGVQISMSATTIAYTVCPRLFLGSLVFTVLINLVLWIRVGSLFCRPMCFWEDLSQSMATASR